MIFCCYRDSKVLIHFRYCMTSSICYDDLFIFLVVVKCKLVMIVKSRSAEMVIGRGQVQDEGNFSIRVSIDQRVFLFYSMALSL